MSEELHVVYRHVGSSSWEAYSRPVSIYSDGRTLEEARENFAVAADFHFGDEREQVTLLEHIERPVIPGVYVRTAIDRRSLDREQVAKVFRDSLTVPAQRDLLEQSDVPLASSGDVVFVACVGSDPLPWVTAQLGRADALQVACRVGLNAVWWMPLASVGAELSVESETLADAGLSSPASTVSDLIQVDHELVTAFPDAPAPVAMPEPAPQPSGNRAARRRRKVSKNKQKSALMRTRRRALIAA